MTKKIIYLILAIITFLTTACTNRLEMSMPLPKKAGDYEQFRIFATKYIEKQMKKYNVPGASIAIVDGNKIIWAKGFGYADKKNKIKANSSTIYRIGSVTKILNALGILKAQEQNRLNINQSITKYLKKFKMKSPKYLTNKITLKSLLAHHSGIGSPDMLTTNFENNPKALDCKYGIKLFQKLYLAYIPNTATVYSNQGVYLSGCILEKVVHMKYTAYIYKNILNPLEMNHSKYGINMNENGGAKPYRNSKQINSAPFYTLSAVGLNSNVMDLGKLIIMIVNNGIYKNKQIIKPASIEEMLKIQNKNIKIDWDNPMALGLFIENHYPEPVYYHMGRSSGYLAAIAFSKKSKLGIVLLVNDDSKDIFLEKVVKKIFQYAWEIKHKKRFKKKLLSMNNKYFKTNFKGMYVLEPNSMDYEPSIIQIAKEHNKYKVQSEYGEFYLKQDNNCYKIRDPLNITDKINEFKKIPKNTCFYTIRNRNTKFIFYRHGNSDDFIIFATKFKNNFSITSWNNYIGTYIPKFIQYNREKFFRFDHLQIIKKNNYFVLKVYLQDGTILKTPLEILDKTHAKVPLMALTSIRVIEIKKDKNNTYLNIGVHKFKKE